MLLKLFLHPHLEWCVWSFFKYPSPVSLHSGLVDAVPFTRSPSILSVPFAPTFFHLLFVLYLFNVVVVTAATVVTVIVVAAVVVGFVNSAVMPCGEHVYSRSLTLFLFICTATLRAVFSTVQANKGNYKIDGNDEKKKPVTQTI